MPKGKIQEWDQDQGEGKIQWSGPVLDFTVSDLLGDPEQIHQGDTVSFQLEPPEHAAMVRKA